VNLNEFIKQERHDVMRAIDDVWSSWQAGVPQWNNVLVEARAVFSEMSTTLGGSATPYLFTTQDHSAKLHHNGDVTEVYEQIVIYMMPHRLGDGVNVCPWSSAGCRATCLESSGRLGLEASNIAKQARTDLLNERPDLFAALLVDEIARHKRRVERKGRRLVVRLNGTSDIPWEVLAPNLFTTFGDVQFFDYTKDGMGAQAASRTTLPANYYLVRSAHERTPDHKLWDKSLGNIVVVLKNPQRKTFAGRRVIDGDAHDMRFLDKQGGYAVVVKAKGKAKNDTSGFAR
jgi:hypothetical protein